MTRRITATVGGRPSPNHHADVVTVQELLNGVDYAEGGPYVKLEVDGLCGPKTQKAIQVFQLKHFGWSGADGRVEPGRQTMALLNAINSRPVVGRTFMLYSIKLYGTLKRRVPRDWFFRVELVPEPYKGRGFPTAVFWFGPKGRAPRYRPAQEEFTGSKWVLFHTPSPCTLQDLAGPAVCTNMEDRDSSKTMPYEKGSTLAKKSGTGAHYNFVLPLEMDKNEPPGPYVSVRSSHYFIYTDYHGDFQLLG